MKSSPILSERMEVHNNKHFTSAVPHKRTSLRTCSKVRKCLQHFANLPFTFIRFRGGNFLLEAFSPTNFLYFVSVLFKQGWCTSSNSKRFPEPFELLNDFCPVDRLVTAVWALLLGSGWPPVTQHHFCSATGWVSTIITQPVLPVKIETWNASKCEVTLIERRKPFEVSVLHLLLPFGLGATHCPHRTRASLALWAAQSCCLSCTKLFDGPVAAQWCSPQAKTQQTPSASESSCLKLQLL